jgi:hypothetical protein
MRYELTDHESAAIKAMLPNKPRGVPRVNDRRVVNGISWCCGPGRLGGTCGELRSNRVVPQFEFFGRSRMDRIGA